MRVLVFVVAWATLTQINWGADVLFLSRFDELNYAASPNVEFIEELQAMGHTVDLQYAGVPLRPLRFDSGILEAVAAADLVIVPPSNPSADSLAFNSGCGPRPGSNTSRIAPSAVTLEFYMNADRPMLILDGTSPYMSSRESLSVDSMERVIIADATHPYVEGLDSPVQMFDWSSIEFPSARAPTITLPSRLPNGANVIATYENQPFLVTANVPSDQAGEMPRVHLGHWDHDLSAEAFYDATTDAFREMLRTITDDLAKMNASSFGPIEPFVESALDLDSNGEYGVGDIAYIEQAIDEGRFEQRLDFVPDGVIDGQDRVELIEYGFQTYQGDSNLDGVFTSGDLVQVFQTGLFETGEPADWSQGDWNGDHTFSASDFVSAFRAGGYCIGPRFASPATGGDAHAIQAASVPEPTHHISMMLLYLIAATTIRGRRAQIA